MSELSLWEFFFDPRIMTVISLVSIGSAVSVWLAILRFKPLHSTFLAGLGVIAVLCLSEFLWLHFLYYPSL